MSDEAIKIEYRTPPADQELIAAARSKPGGWVYDIDYKYPADQPTPPEAIRGVWEVSSQGILTGQYSPNARYRPIQHVVKLHKPYMTAGARSNRNQWIVDIDPRGESLFPDIPSNLILGWWYVDRNGIITDLFRPNSLWRPSEQLSAE